MPNKDTIVDVPTVNKIARLSRLDIPEFNKESLQFNSLDIINLAKSEGLYSHANSVQIRFED